MHPMLEVPCPGNRIHLGLFNVKNNEKTQGCNIGGMTLRRFANINGVDDEVPNWEVCVRVEGRRILMWLGLLGTIIEVNEHRKYEEFRSFYCYQTLNLFGPTFGRE